MRLHTTLGAATLLAVALSAQSPTGTSNLVPVPQPAPQWALDAFDVTRGTVQDLQIPTDRRDFTFAVLLDGTTASVRLSPNDVRAADFKLLVDDGNQLRQLPTPPSVTFRGLVTNQPASVAAGSVIAGRLQAILSLGDGSANWGIESLASVDPTQPATRCLVYSVADAKNPGSHRCGTDDSTHVNVPGGPTIQSRKIAEIAIDCDLEYYQRNGSNTTNTTNAATNLINGMDAIYQRDVDIEYTLTTVIVRTSRRYSNTDMRQLLPEFLNYWNANHGSVRRDVAHLLTGKGSFSGIVGIAYLGVICNRGSAYGVDKAFSGFGTNVGLISHEAGHNWNAPHCDGASPCNIMCSGLGGCNRNLSSFGTSSINTIVAFKNSRGCLDDPVSRPVISSVTPSVVQVFPHRQMTIAGTGLTGTTQVRIGSQSISSFTVSGDTQIVLTSPLPTALGSMPVSVTNSAGTSNSVMVRFDPTNPPVHTAPPFAVRNIQIFFDEAGDPSDQYVLHASFNSNATFPFQGFDILLNTLPLDSGALSTVGYNRFTLQVPNVPLGGVQMFSQLILLDENTGNLNFVTPATPTVFFQ